MSGIPPKCPYCFAPADMSRHDRVAYKCGSYYGEELEGEFHQSVQCSGHIPGGMSGAMKCPEPGCLNIKTSKNSFCTVHGVPCDIPLTWKNLADLLVKRTEHQFREIKALKEKVAESEGHEEKLWNWNNLRDEVDNLRALVYRYHFWLRQTNQFAGDPMVDRYLVENKHVEDYVDY